METSKLLLSDELVDVEMALQARQEAYAPYSNFLVGAAIRTKDEQVFAGWNVENAIYDVLHAEIGALGRIPEASRVRGFKRITVVASPRGDAELVVAAAPCGACLQKLFEFVRSEDNPEILMATISRRFRRALMRQLLTDGFSLENADR